MIRDATAADLAPLSALARRSKAHWGYDDAFMAACADELTVTPDMLDNQTVRLFEDSGTRHGFYAVSVKNREAGVELFFVDPPAIGRGVGAALWHDLVLRAQAGVTGIRIESDPEAEGFYLRMGAVRTGLCPSGSIPGRQLPLLHYDLNREVT
jgi:GNAT superfamily N-acetyltransferase